MIKNTLKGLALGALALSFTACSITLPVTATSNAVGSKIGTAKGTVIIGLGNTLLMDDGVGIQVARILRNIYLNIF